MTMIDGATFAIRMAAGRVMGADAGCPHCGVVGRRVGTRMLVMELRRCSACGLMYRYPKDSQSENREFYQEDYKNIVSSLPSKSDLAAWRQREFRDTPMDLRAKVEVLKSYCPGGKVLDFGCSWGYMVWQLTRADYDATGYEISEPRARYGADALGVKIRSDWTAMVREAASSPFDAIVANHVLEHLPEIGGIFSDFAAMLRPGGVLLVFVPDCTGCDDPGLLRKKGSGAFGRAHSLAFDVGFFERNLPGYGFTVRTDRTPRRTFEPALKEQLNTIRNLNDRELMVVAHRVGASRSEPSGS